MSDAKRTARLPQLQPNEKIGKRFFVVSKLNEREVRAVYKVKDSSNNFYELNIEPRVMEAPELRNDQFVLEHADIVTMKHFCKIYAKGKTDKYTFLVMTLLGSSLHEISHARRAPFTPSTAIRAGIQCLEAIESLHRIGYLHRDVRPFNFAVGREDIGDQKNIYIVDFFPCRKYVSDDGNTMRRPRTKCPFMGSIKYAPLSSHRQTELSPKDDIESWFYQQMKFTNGIVPWDRESNKDAVRKYKEDIRTPGHPTRVEMFKTAPEEYEIMFNHITALDYYTMPDYRMIYLLMQNTMRKYGITDSQPYDWERTERSKYGSAPAQQLLTAYTTSPPNKSTMTTRNTQTSQSIYGQRRG